MIRFALTILCLLLPSLSNADLLRIAVASNFTHTLNTLLPEFENDTGHDVEISSASSGKPYVTLHSEDIIHPLKEVDGSAMGWATTPEQVVEVIRYTIQG